MQVLILPDFFDFREHLVLWRKAAARGALIEWELAREYFRPPQVWIDYRNISQPVLMDREPEET
jgi:hypothetical protein